MQYTSKIALLAVALFGTSALALPYAGEVGYDVEAREVDNDDLSARDFFEMYLEARADPSLDARDLESLDFDAREYFNYLEAREAATTAIERPQTPLSPQPSHPETNEHSHSDHVTSHSETKDRSNVHLTPHQEAMRLAKSRAAKEFEDPKVYRTALADKDNKNHRFAVLKYLSKPKHLKKALADADSPYHKAAKRIVHKRKAKAYLEDKKNFRRALRHKRHRYHKDAVKLYFSRGDNFKTALSNKKSRFHKAAVREYLLDTKIRKTVLSDPTNPFYKQAEKLQKKIDKKHNRVKLSADSPPADSTNKTSTPVAAKKA